jgi:hypothetical protein
LPIVFEPTSSHGGAVAMVGRAAGLTVAFRSAAVEVGIQGKKAGQLQLEFDGAQSTVPSGAELQKSQHKLPSRQRSGALAHACSELCEGPLCRVVSGYRGCLLWQRLSDGARHHRVSRCGLPTDPHACFQQASLSLGNGGARSLALEDGSLQMPRSVVYQEEGGKRKRRSGSFTLLPDGDIGFVVEGGAVRRKRDRYIGTRSYRTHGLHFFPFGRE